MYMIVMVAYVSLSPARYEIFAGLVDCAASLGEVAHFGKTFGFYMVILKRIPPSTLFY